MMRMSPQKLIIRVHIVVMGKISWMEEIKSVYGYRRVEYAAAELVAECLHEDACWV